MTALGEFLAKRSVNKSMVARRTGLSKGRVNELMPILVKFSIGSVITCNLSAKKNKTYLVTTTSRSYAFVY